MITIRADIPLQGLWMLTSIMTHSGCVIKYSLHCNGSWVVKSIVISRCSYSSRHEDVFRKWGNVGSGWKWLISFTLRPFYSREGIRLIRWIRGLMGSRADLRVVVAERKTSALSGNRIPAFHPEAGLIMRYPGSRLMFVHIWNCVLE
jgi:hypothetical protein